MPVRERIIGVGKLNVATQDEVEDLLASFGNGPMLHGTDDGNFHRGIMQATPGLESRYQSGRLYDPPAGGL